MESIKNRQSMSDVIRRFLKPKKNKKRCRHLGEPCSLTVGVPQGSVLSPFLFTPSHLALLFTDKAFPNTAMQMTLN